MAIARVKKSVGAAKRGAPKESSGKPRSKVNGFGNKPDDMNGLPPSRHNVLDNLAHLGLS